MTRFARAKGSKASNERVFEEATSWEEMKNQLLERQSEIEEAKKRKEADEKRNANYQQFLKEKEQEALTETKWAEFPEHETNGKTKSKAKKKLVSKVEQDSGVDEDDDAPAEVSSKVELEEPKVKKAKIKKTKLKIEGIKRKREENEKESKKVMKAEKKPQEKKVVDLETLPEADRKKILRKQEKRKKQVAKKMLKKKETLNNSVEQKKNFENKVLNKKSTLKTGDFKRRKEFQENKVTINGREVDIQLYDGFPIKKEDAEHLKQLRREMIAKGLPRSEIDKTLKLERRKAEKSLAREKKKVCFNCRKFGHNLSDCPELPGKDDSELVDTAGTGICFKCGSTEHTSFACRVVQGQTFKFATCFICKEQGHISRQCPDNGRGLYPKGGACKVCGDVTHLKKDCPRYQTQQLKEQDKYQVETIGGENPEDLGNREVALSTTRKNKVIKF